MNDFGQTSTLVCNERVLRLGDSVVTQFVTDLTTYGLREALAYLFENQRRIPKPFVRIMLNGYGQIGNRFLSQQEKIHKELLRRLRECQHSKDLSDCLDRLIFRDAIDFNDPWRDGYEQQNLASTR